MDIYFALWEESIIVDNVLKLAPFSADITTKCIFIFSKQVICLQFSSENALSAKHVIFNQSYVKSVWNFDLQELFNIYACWIFLKPI